MIQLVARAPFESSFTSYSGDLIVIVRFGVVSASSGLPVAAGAVLRLWNWAAAADRCGGGVCVDRGVSVRIASSVAGFRGVKKYDQPNRTIIDRTAAIKNAID